MRNARRLLRALVLSAVVASIIVPASAAVATPSPQSIQAQIKAADAAFDKLVDQYDGIDQQLTNNEKAEATLKTQIAPAMLASQVAQAKVGQYAAAAYMAGPVSTLNALISSTSLGNLLNTMSALNEIAHSQNRQINDYQQTIATYNVSKQKLDTLITTETAQRTSLAAQKNTLKAKIAALYALNKKAYGTSTAPGGGTSGKAPSYPGRGGKIVKFAYAQLGKPYSFGATGPGSYDCSGLVLAAYETVGISFYHQTTAMWDNTKVFRPISRADLEPGDVVFYQKGDIHHVAIYIGNGNVIHAPEPGDHVRIAGMDMMPISGYRRVV